MDVVETPAAGNLLVDLGQHGIAVVPGAAFAGRILGNGHGGICAQPQTEIAVLVHGGYIQHGNMHRPEVLIGINLGHFMKTNRRHGEVTADDFVPTGGRIAAIHPDVGVAVEFMPGVVGMNIDDMIDGDILDFGFPVHQGIDQRQRDGHGNSDPHFGMVFDQFDGLLG